MPDVTMTRRTVLSFGVLTGVMASGYGVMFTVLDDFRERYGISESRLGMIVGIGFVSSFLAQVFLAPVADRGHARRLVYFGLVLNVVGLMLLAFGQVLWVLLAGRFISGVGLGMAFPAIRRIVILGDPDRLGDNLGLLLAADVTGFASGPVLSALLVGTLGLPAPFIVIAAGSIALLPLVGRIHVEESVEQPAARLAFDLLKSAPYVAAVCLGTALFVMIGTFDALWVVMLDDLDAAEWIANLGISIFVIPLIFLGEYGGKLAQRLGPFRVGPIGLLLGAVYMVLYGVLPSALVMLGVGAIHAITDGLTVSSAAVAVGMVTPESRHAGAQGLLGGIQTLCAGAFAVIAGFLYERTGRLSAYLFCAAAMVGLVAASLILIGSRRSMTGGAASAAAAVTDPATAVTGHA